MYYFIVLLTVTRLLFQTVPVLSALSSADNSDRRWPPGKLGYNLVVDIRTSSLNNNGTVDVWKEGHPIFLEVRIDGDDGLIGDVLIGDKSFIGRPLRDYYPELAAYLQQKLFIRSSRSSSPSWKFIDDLEVGIASGFEDKTVLAAVRKEDGSHIKAVKVGQKDGLIYDVLDNKFFIGKPLKEYYPALDAYLKKRHFIENSSSMQAQLSYWEFLGFILGLLVLVGIFGLLSAVSSMEDDSSKTN